MSDSSKIKSIIERFKIRPEMEFKIKTNTGVIESYENLYKEISNQIDNEKISNLEKARLRLELCQLESTIYYKKNRLDFWLQHQEEYEIYLEKYSRESHELFDEVLAECKRISANNIRLKHGLNNWEKNGENASQEDKVEFYLFLKMELFNRQDVLDNNPSLKAKMHSVKKPLMKKLKNSLKL